MNSFKKFPLFKILTGDDRAIEASAICVNRALSLARQRDPALIGSSGNSKDNYGLWVKLARLLIIHYYSIPLQDESTAYEQSNAPTSPSAQARVEYANESSRSPWL